MTKPRGLRSGLQWLLLGGLLMLVPPPLLEAASHSPALPPTAKIQGIGLGDWAGLWWQWVLGIPADTNPLFDDTGAFCDVDQGGQVFFLAGTFGGSAERSCTVPTGRHLFAPLLNSVYIATDPGDPDTADEIRPLLLPDLLGAVVACEVDGQPVPRLDQYLVESSLFTTPLTLFDMAGEYGPAMTVGYHVLLPPLSAGEHTVYIYGYSPVSDFEVEVTYHLTVVGGPKS